MKRTVFLIILFGLLIFSGVFRQEFTDIYNHAVVLCLACIGIG